jgi:hypothetical protein
MKVQFARFIRHRRNNFVANKSLCTRRKIVACLPVVDRAGDLCWTFALCEIRLKKEIQKNTSKYFHRLPIPGSGSSYGAIAKNLAIGETRITRRRDARAVQA